MAFQPPSASVLSTTSVQMTASALSPVEKTLLIPLAARAHGARLFPQMALHDTCAASALSKLEVEADDYLSQFERDQLKWDGKISHPDKVLQVA